jgi:hypothetical protein
MTDALVLIGLELGVSGKLLYDIHKNDCPERNRCRFVFVLLLTAHTVLTILKLKGFIHD